MNHKFLQHLKCDNSLITQNFKHNHNIKNSKLINNLQFILNKENLKCTSQKCGVKSFFLIIRRSYACKLI